MEEHPSTALIMLPDLDVAGALELVDDALTGGPRRPSDRDGRFVRTEYTPRPSHTLARDEWIGLVASAIGEPRSAVLILADVDQVFRLALWLSAARPELIIAAWRRYRGLDPCLKVFHRGGPVWRDGADPDHEVDWVVPTELSEAMFGYSETHLPQRADEPPRLLRGVLRSYREALAAPLDHEIAAGWLDRESPFAP